METVYWEVNGEVRVRKEELLKRFEQLRQTERALFIEEEGDEFGYFSTAIYAAPHPERRHGLELWVERKWIPAFGYAWSEFQVKRLEVY